MKIFEVFTSGYDSNESLGYFSKRKDAEEFKKLYRNVPIGYRDDSLHIKEVEIDVPRINWFQYYVRMTKAGKVIEAHKMMLEKEGLVCFDAENQMLWCINTKDKEYAIKKVNDIRLKLIEEGKWGRQPPINRKKRR